MSEKVIITGGAGYLGSSTAEWLRRKGFTPIALDNYSTSHRKKLPFEVIEVDLADPKATAAAFHKAAQGGKISAVFHFAAFALVSESVAKPTKYFHNNVNSATHVADQCAALKIPSLIHSSSCAVYGIPLSDKAITEEDPKNPLSPYGETKVTVERVLNQYAKDNQFRVLHLRYFNPAGNIGEAFAEAHEPETHLVPRLIEAGIMNRAFEIYGTDYPTPDGTCIRDLIHVADLVEAHRLGLEFVRGTDLPHMAINVGLGKGVSVKETVALAEGVLKKKIQVKTCPARAGDPPRLVAATDLAKSLLKFVPQKTVTEMLTDDWHWREKHLK